MAVWVAQRREASKTFGERDKDRGTQGDIDTGIEGEKARGRERESEREIEEKERECETERSGDGRVR